MSDPHMAIDEFTPRQRDILRRALSGAAPKEIARCLGLTQATVYWHQRNTYYGAGVVSLPELFSWALRHRECCGIEGIFPAAIRRPIEMVS